MADFRQYVTRVAHLDCEHDAAAIERGLREEPGIVSLEVYPRSAKVVVVYDPQVTSAEEINRRLTELGFPPVIGRELPKPPKLWRNPKVLAAVASGVLVAIGWLGGRAGVPEPVPTVLYLLSMIIGGYYFGREAIEKLLFQRVISIEMLMAVAAVVAALLGQALEGATLVFLYSISEALEGYTEDKTRSAIRALMSLAPKVALVRRDGKEVEVPVEELKVGDIFIVKPGQSIPTDGIVIAGESSVDESPITGESIPVEKQVGSQVFAGSINGHGVLEVRATKTAADNTLARIIAMVEEAQERKGKSQQFIERFGRRYSPIVLGVGALIALVPPLLLGAPWMVWVLRGTIFIVAAAPCALVIGVPLTYVATLGVAARHGVLIKGGIYLEELAQVKVIAMDKTGTLTRGRPRVTDVVPLNGYPEDEVLRLAAAVEVRSEHPLASAIVALAEDRGIAIDPVEEMVALPGAGARGRLNGTTVVVGRPDAFGDKQTLSALEQQIRQLQEQGKTLVLVAVSADGEGFRPIGLLALRDEPRPGAAEVIEELHRKGVRVAMLTGDNERTARAIAAELGIDEVYAALRPEDKVTKVRELRQRYGHLAMVGDGVNDAPALAEASVGIAMGAAGTDVAMETADVVLMADDLSKVPYALHLAYRNRTIVRQNVAFALAVVALLVVGALSGVLSLPVTVLGHELSEFGVIGNSLRMLRE